MHPSIGDCPLSYNYCQRWNTFIIVVVTSCLINVSTAQVPPLEHRPWNRDLVYFAMTDRFRDGDPANNRPAGSAPGLYDPHQIDINKYHGGDLRGLELALQENYFNDLGVTAIWITPPVKNAWHSGFDLGGAKTGYHGYWAQDFLDIDPHLVSSRALDGTTYPQSRDGRMQHYKDFVKLAHEHNIKIVQDVVCNHVGPLFYYDVNGNAAFDVEEAYEWIAPFRRHGFHETARWAHVPQWNLEPTEPGGPLRILQQQVDTTGVLQQLETYGRKGFNADSLGKSDGEEVICDFFALRDVWTDPGSPHFAKLVDEFVKIYKFYIEEVGVDGLRIDTVKHAHHGFWDAFTERLRASLGAERAARVLMFGEVYDGNPRHLGAYTYRTDFPGNKSPCLDSLLNFQFCFCLRDYLRVADAAYGSPAGLQRMMDEMNSSGDEALYNPSPGSDGLSSRQKMVNFFENHDGINRFLVANVDSAQHLLALSILMTLEGVPCIYYGSELPLQDERGRVGRDGESGRLTFCRQGAAEYLKSAKSTIAFRTIQTLAAYRQRFPALHHGRMAPLWVDRPDSDTDDGLFCFARYLENAEHHKHTVLIVINAHPERSSTTAAPGGIMRLLTPEGQPLVDEDDQLRDLSLPMTNAQQASPTATITWTDGEPQASITVPPRSVRLLVVD